MIIMKTDATQEQIEQVIKEIGKYGLRADVSRGDFRTVIGLVGDERRIPFGHFGALPGVKEARMVETPYKLISREYTRFFKEPGEHMTIKAGNVIIGGDEPVFICGPCTIEGKAQLFCIAEGVKKAGAQVLRGGIFKPRSSVHSFQGLGATDWKKAEEALKWLYQAGGQFDMPVVTEVRGEAQVDMVAEYSDILQIVARNMLLPERTLIGLLPDVGRITNNQLPITKKLPITKAFLF